MRATSQCGRRAGVRLRSRSSSGQVDKITVVCMGGSLSGSTCSNEAGLNRWRQELAEHVPKCVRCTRKTKPACAAGWVAGSNACCQRKTALTAQRGAFAITFVFGPDREDSVHGVFKFLCFNNAAESERVDGAEKKFQKRCNEGGLQARWAALAVALVIGPNSQRLGMCHGITPCIGLTTAFSRAALTAKSKKMRRCDVLVCACVQVGA